MKTKINTTSKFKRLYGMNLEQLATKFGLPKHRVYMMHNKGLLKDYQIASDEMGNINPYIGKLWRNISGRCNDPRTNKFQYYGGRGIKNLLSLEDLIYIWKRDNADAMKQPSIDRINRDGHYEIGNCRIIEFSLNRINRKYPPTTRIYYGREHTIEFLKSSKSLVNLARIKNIKFFILNNIKTKVAISLNSANKFCEAFGMEFDKTFEVRD